MSLWFGTSFLLLFQSCPIGSLSRRGTVEQGCLGAQLNELCPMYSDGSTSQVPPAPVGAIGDCGVLEEVLCSWQVSLSFGSDRIW